MNIELQNIYKKYFEKYLSSIINLNDYNRLIDESNLSFGEVNKVQLKSNLEEYLNLNHFYILNNFYIEKLSPEEQNLLQSTNEEEILSLVKRTYKDIITKSREDFKRFKINYTFSTAETSFSYNDELVIGIYYGSNKEKYNSEDLYLENYQKKKEFLNELSTKLKNEIKEKLFIDTKIIVEKI
ncbi:MAG: hypothetical protein IJL76_02985 [Bacilli bacterium]|nr:hypothetical protein [Bacilli bacterium]